MDALKVIIGSVFGGILIGAGGVACLLSEYRFIGALAFTVGLFGILTYRFGLYTGKIGYALDNPPSFMLEVVLTIVGNFIGCLAMGLAFPLEEAAVSVQARLSADDLTVLFRAVCCGLLVFIAVDQYKTKKSYLALFICVPAFILAGFEHSIADMFYIASAGVFTVDSLIFLMIVLFGNAIGCLAIPAYRKYIDKTEPEPKV